MNQEEENKNIGSEKKYENFLRDGIVVHTMPKSFRRAKSASEGSHMSAGVFVMAGGLILLVGLGFLLYYMVVKKDFFSLNKNIDMMIEEEKAALGDNEKKDTNPVATTTSLINATSTEALVDGATSTIDDLINEFNQDLSTSTFSTSSESLDISSSIDSTTINSDIVNSGESYVRDELKKEAIIGEATDSDADGLSDLEEVLLGTDFNKMDTDGDGYSDFQELDKMYDPVGKGSLASNKAITSYSNPTHGYSLIYPMAWTPSNFDKDDSIMFKIDGFQFVQIIVQPIPDNQVIEEWYKKTANIDMINESQKVSTKAGWSGIVSKDGLNYYLTKNGSSDVYIISYNLGASNALNYQKLFEMMVNSLDVVN
ncbi:hypothetical protein L6270_02715 [Candidatus Parcubacteria bacterium]|nr:hypothetical protein [Patescibacteria group bacterium]MBU4309937.1 hypothetical protein [Patescibacteria group bacterium]MBU4432247.1 hypothetical protein [Patescibacteria group bacterium]MBU4577862.1 hypothetical protein [Patescibacteria group bacterium]MCG2696923.1 hypothetical protein [Candidatus Parcubacteria bacterium]